MDAGEESRRYTLEPMVQETPIAQEYGLRKASVEEGNFKTGHFNNVETPVDSIPISGRKSAGLTVSERRKSPVLNG
jgi:hypothetical protein